MTSSDVIFGGDLAIVVSLFDPIIEMYDRAKAESFVLATNMFRISNILIASSEAWEDITSFGERYILSTAILSNIDNMGYLYLSENPFNKEPKIFNFSNVAVKLAPFSLCYEFTQASWENIVNYLKKIFSIVVALHMIHVARVQSAFRGKFMTTQTTPVKALLQQLSSTTRKISFFLLSKIIPKQIYPLSSAFPLTPAQKCRLLMNLHQ